jgi:hypothetical protein
MVPVAGSGIHARGDASSVELPALHNLTATDEAAILEQ